MTAPVSFVFSLIAIKSLVVNSLSSHTESFMVLCISIAARGLVLVLL